MSKANAKDNAAHQNVDAVAARAHDAVDWATDATNSATDNLNDKGHELKATQEKWLATARGYVQDNPAISVGIAVAGGYLLSRILRSR